MLFSSLYVGSDTLRVLNITSNYDIGDDGMKVISEALQHCKSFTSLCVCACGLELNGMVAI